ncbi:MAG: helix-turn-helix domain-containing protein [Acholeplasmataceae bacterium]|nr:helix-turn-helix domain-containing protein [Acholeplasmataceae bacterium]
MKSKELCVFLERLRSARNLSQESFTDGVVSLRQYRRYLSGESEVPFQVIQLLTEKIGVKTDNLLREFEIVKVKETDLTYKLFNLAVNYAHEEYVKLSKELPLNEVIDKTNQLLYQHSMILDNLYSNKITVEEAALSTAELINYPDILDSQIITSVEMIILSSLLDFLDESHHLAIVEKAQKFITDPSLVITGGSEKMFIFILAKIAKFYGIHEDYENVIRLCERGVKQNLTIRSYYLMEYFYYYQALAFYKLDKLDAYEQMVVNCFNVLHFEGNLRKIEKFTRLIEEDFNIDFVEFVTNFYAKQLGKFQASNES